MPRYRAHTSRLLALSLGLALGLLAAAPAWAAQPTQVTADWKGGVSGLPSDVTMYTYVPSKVATNPPLLTLIHYCGGSAQAVFGQAGGIVSAADQYGFIIVVPSNANASGSNGRCWDVTSSKAHTRNGGGDSHAIIQMVKYAISQYQANANRVYSTGDSSGAMMTELLLALYPDIYKAGATFAGVPAGCSNEFDSQGLCGLPAQTAQQWGDRVRAMYAGYSGYRPRVQLFHGDADGTINYKNHTEAIKEWTNVLGLSPTPTSMDSGLTLGTHQGTRQRWQNSCGQVVLDAFTSIGGDHGPSDALFLAQYVVPFLGLDKTGPTDPEVAACGDGGAGTTGGASGSDGGTGGRTTDGGASTGGPTTEGGASTGGRTTDGGASTGGRTTGGGTGTVGGGTITGGAGGTTGARGGSDGGAMGATSGSSTTGAGATSGTGLTSGAGLTGGTSSTNESTGGGGASSNGGSTAAGGTTGVGATGAVSGASTGAGASGTTVGSGTSGKNTSSDLGDSPAGCGCRVSGGRGGEGSAGGRLPLVAAIAATLTVTLRRRRRRADVRVEGTDT